MQQEVFRFLLFFSLKTQAVCMQQEVFRFLFFFSIKHWLCVCKKKYSDFYCSSPSKQLFVKILMTAHNICFCRLPNLERIRKILINIFFEKESLFY